MIRPESLLSLLGCTQASLSSHRVLSVVVLVVHAAADILRRVDQSSDASLPGPISAARTG